MFGKFSQNIKDTSKNVTKCWREGGMINLWISQACVYRLEDWRTSLYIYLSCNIFGDFTAGQLLIKLK